MPLLIVVKTSLHLFIVKLSNPYVNQYRVRIYNWGLLRSITSDPMNSLWQDGQGYGDNGRTNEGLCVCFFPFPFSKIYIEIM